MEHDAGKVPRVDDAEGSAATIEIKIKTLDSQTYTLRVDKQMPVPALKEQIASVTGVLSEQQRLICRGKVLKDDQLLSAYHVEDGHTLHLVVRQPVPPSSQSSPNHPETDPASSTMRGHSGRAPSVVIETISMPHQGDTVPSEISRIVTAVIGSFGFPSIGSGIDGLDATRDRGMQTEQTGTGGGSDRPALSAFGFPSAVPFGSMHPPVIQDSLTTLSQYLSHARREFTAVGSGRVNNAETDVFHGTELRDSSSTRQLGTVPERLSTPAALAEVLLSSRQLFVEEVAECLLQLGRQLESQATVTDPAIRLTTQSNAWRTGLQLYNLGAFVLEIGRATMTLQLGQSPSEAVVNPGPAVFINSSGPNPLMVQPIPFQLGTSFGNIPIGSVQPGSGLGGGIGSGFLPRRIDIQIRRGPSTATTTDNQQERGDAQQPSGQRNAATATVNENTGSQSSLRVSGGLSPGGEPDVRVVPIRTMVAAIPSPLSQLHFESSGNSMGLYVPVLGRFQQSSTGNLSGGQPSQSLGEHHPDVVQTEQRSFAESDPQMQNIEQRIRDVIGRLQDVNSGHASSEQGLHVSGEQQSAPGPAIQRPSTDHQTVDGSILSSTSSQPNPSNTGSINIDILSTGVAQNTQESTQHVPENMFLHFLRNLFPESEVHVEDVSTEPATTGAVPESSEPSARHVEPEPDSRVDDEGIFFSNLLHQIMPVISQHISPGPEAMAPGEAPTLQRQRMQDSSTQTESCDVGASRPTSESDADVPNAKRQKME